MNIALTGANGSIGRELTPFLKGLGHNIYTISSSVQRDGERIFSYADLFGKTINVKIDIFFHLATINSQLSENQIVIDTMLKKCNQLVHELRLKLKSKIDEILKLRKDLDLEKEEHQLTQLKYESMRDNLNKVITDKLNAARAAVEEIQK